MFNFRGLNCLSPWGSKNSRHGASVSASGPGYPVRYKDLGKLHKAAHMGKVPEVQRLLSLRPDRLNDRDKMKRTALHLACANGHLGVATLLADRKCHMDLHDNEGRTALIKAVQCGEDECATLLLERGADPDIKDTNGNSALHCAIHYEDVAMATKLLLHKADIEARNKKGLTPFLLAVSENKQQMVEFLIKRNANIHALDNMRRTALMLAVSDESSNIVRLLLQQGVDVFAQDDLGRTAEIIACFKGTMKNCKLISDYQQERRCKESSKNSNLDTDQQISPKQVLRKTNATTDSPETYPHLEPVVEVKDPHPNKTVVVKNVQTYISDTDQQISPKQVLRKTNATTVKAAKQNQQREKAHGTVWKKPDSPETYPHLEPVVEVKDPHPNKTVVVKNVQTYISDTDQQISPKQVLRKTNATTVKAAKQNQQREKAHGTVWKKPDSPETYPHLEPVVEVKDPHPNKTVVVKNVQTYISDTDQQISPKQVLRKTNATTVKAAKQNQQREKAHGTVWKKPDSPETYPHLEPVVEVKDPHPNKTVVVKNVQTYISDTDQQISPKQVLRKTNATTVKAAKQNQQREKAHGTVWKKPDSPETYPHLEPVVEVKDPHPNKTVVVKNVQTYISDTDQQISPKQVLRKTNATTVKAAKQNQQREKAHGTVWKKPDSPETYPHLEPVVEVKDPHPNKTVVVKNVQTYISVAECSKKVSTSSLSSVTGIDDSWSTSEDKDFEVDTKEGPTKRAFGKKENGMDIIESALQERTNHANLTYVDGAHKSNRSVKMSALGLGEDEDIETPWDPESFSASQPQKHVDHFSGSSDQRGKNKLTKKVEDSPETYPRLEPVVEVKDPDPNKTVAMKNVATSISELHLGRTSEEEQVNLDGTENNHPHVSESHYLLHEIAKLRLEINTVKRQHQAMEKQYCENFAIVKEKNEYLQRKIKMNKETIFQYKGQLNVLTAENTMLNSKLDNEKQKEDQLKTEAESYHLRLLTAATHDYEQSQKSISSLQLAFQEIRDECFHSQDKMNLHMSILKDNNETLLQRLSKVESKFNSLETGLHHTRDALTETTLVLERVQRDLSQTQRQKEEIEHMYQSERGKVYTYMGRLESLEERFSHLQRKNEERFSHLQSENMLLRQQLDDARKTSDNNEKTVNEIQDRLQDIVKIFQTECETQGRILEERDKQLIHELNHLKERMYQYERDKAEREVVVRQLQELADTVKKLLMTQASLEYTSRYRMHLEAETQDLKKTSEHIRSHSQDEKEQLKNYIELNQSLKLRLDQEKKKTSELGKKMTIFKKFFKITRRELNESENGDLSFSEDLKPNQIDMDIQINRFKQKIDDLTAELETASSERKHLNEKTKYLQQELLAMKGIEKKCEKLENKEKELKHELLNLKCHMTPNMVENSEVEHYKQEIEERARQDVAEKLKVNVFLQGQAASQEYFDQLRENNNAAMKSQMELRIKDLELELSKVKTSLGESTKEELELYKQLYLEEAKMRTSLENQLNKSNERPAEISTPLAVKERQNTLLSTAMKTPVLEPPCVGSLHNRSLLSRNLDPRENLVISTSTPWTSNVTQRLI